MRLPGLVRGQHVDLLRAMHGVPQVQARTQFQVTGVEHAFEQQHWPTPTERAHTLRLVQVKQGKAVGRLQSGKSTLDAVPVGIGLHHRPEPGIRRGLPDTRQVVP